MNKLTFNRMLALLSTMTLVSGSQAVYAQATADEAEEIVITGFKASLQKAQALKQDSTSIVEAVVAEDIGKLPDSSIAETLARLPGLAGERRNGRTSGLSVRGFKEDYVGTTMNGRELLGIGDNRGVEYDLYPSEIMSGAVVYKSPDASLAAPGIGGSVDLRTIRPLDVAPRLAVSGTYEQNGLKSDNPDFDDSGHRYSLSYSGKFADDTIGLALAGATTSSPTQQEQFGAWGYSKNPAFDNAYTPDGIGSYAISNLLERDAIAGVLQFRPNDQLDITLDALHIKFKEEGIMRGIVQGLSLATATSVVDGVVTSGKDAGFASVVRTDPSSLDGKLDTYGLNAAYQINDDLGLKFDIAHSKSSKDDFRAESYSGVGRAGLSSQGPVTTRDWQLGHNGLVFSNNSTDFSDYGIVKLAGPQAWGGSLQPVTDFASTPDHPTVGPAQAQDGFINDAIFAEKLDSIRLEATQKIDNSFITAVNFGAQYSKRTKSKDNGGAFATAPTWPNDGPIPEQYRRGVADMTWMGLDKIVAYDALSMYKNGYYTLTDAAALEPDRMGDTYSIEEKVLMGFVKADFETTLDGERLYGNFGLQAVNTDQSSDGYISLTGSDLFVTATPVSGGDKYNKFLPSLNLNYNVAESQIIRFAAAKTISRARFDYLKAGSSVKFTNNVANVTNADPEKGPWTSNSGNPTLRPMEANQVDLAYDWYFANDGYLSVGTFYKDLVNWQRAGKEIVDFTPYYIPGYHQAIDTNNTVYTPATFQGVNNFREDGLKGSVHGLETQANLPLRELAEVLDGVGVIASASFTDGKLDDGSRVPGLSKRVSQLTIYYQNAGFEFRIAGTKRSSFLSEERGGSNTLADVSRQPTELVDAQISYDFSASNIDSLKGLRVSLQGQNLTDEDDVNALDADSRLVTKSQHYGPNYLLTLNYKL